VEEDSAEEGISTSATVATELSPPPAIVTPETFVQPT